jgi:peptidoglycan/xylan/chitin deacetylase (PgdA/CDA1 family)
MLEDVTNAEETIALASGKRPEWFRPPFGVTNPTVAITVNKKGYKVMGWSIRSLDTSSKDPEKIFERIKKRWHPGGIILLHDTNDRVLDVLGMIIEHALKEGYRFVRADRLSF